MQTSPPACLRHAVNGMLGAQKMREGTNLHMRVSQWLSTRLGGVHKKITQRSFLCVFCLYNVKIYANELKHASEQGEKVEDKVEVAVLFAETVDDGTDGVCNSAEKQIDERLDR